MNQQVEARKKIEEAELLQNELELSNITLDECQLELTQCILEPIVSGIIKLTENQKLLRTNVFRIKKINHEGIESPFYVEGNIVVIPSSLKGGTIPMSLKAKDSKGNEVVKKYLLATTYDLKLKLSSYATILSK